ncbi:hypothetical protein [Desulfogranum mediterraneum]|uniref:hypothetical protein n=1 Tax=Desulfogranum mediterraneum TaxID=160661 RepID=UPI0003FB4DB0|nr:hypothetical protein [Desulfogranum mediterraneum]
MNRSTLWIAALALLLVGLGSWFYLHTDDSRLIRRQLAQLSELANKEEQEPPLKALQRAARIGKAFSDPCLLELADHQLQGSYSRKELVDQIFLIRRQSSQLRVELYDLSITIDQGQQSQPEATVAATLVAAGLEGDDQPPLAEELQLHLNQEQGEWLIDSVRFNTVLER